MSVSSPPILKILSDLDIDLMDVNNDVDYLRALMEATNALVITNASDKRIPVLQKEIQRVRADRKKADPRFKVKKTTVSPQKIMGQKMLPAAKLDAKKLAPKGGGSDTLSQILISVTSIRDILINQIKDKRDDAKKKRRATETANRKEKESGLEVLKKGFKGIKKGAEKVIKPVKNLFKQILDFIGKIVLGRIVFKLLKWFSDKKNQAKVAAIGKFLKKTWPVLLAAYLLFGNSFGRMTVKLGVMITRFTIKLVRQIIPALWAAIGKMKMGKLMNMIPGGRGGIKGTLLKGAVLFGGGMLLEKAIAGDSLSQSDMMSDVQEFNKGGQVPGSGPNKDTVPAMLTPGEFVMSRGAVEKYGVGTMKSMNAAAGGTNEPELKSVPHFNEGGNVASGMDGVIEMMGSTGMMGPTGMMGASGMDGVTEMLVNMNLLGLSGLGGGGGGTNAITDKAMNKSVGTRTRDIGNLFARPFRKGKTDPRSQFATDINLGFQGGGIVPGYEGGGLIGGKNFMQSVKNRDYGWSIKPPKPSIVQAYKDEQAKIITVGGDNNSSKSGGKNDLPDINAAAKRSLPKIKTLGISV